METVTLVDMGPIIAAVLGPMLACMFVLMRYQHKDSVKTRELISESNREIRDWVTEQLERLSDRLSAELKDLGRGLADARERLARIEGHLGIGGVRPKDGAGEQDSNAA